ncbi:MAG: hypothetical protein JNL39_04335 [Opitutaceae bacterium]|nr:hypothetical protein [Opitutaceae bacterium]
MSVPIPAGYEHHVAAHAQHAGLTCRFLKPADFKIAEVPAAEVDFSKGAQFMPLAVAITHYGPMVFTVAARPAFGDGAVSQWLEYICRAENYPHTPVTETRIGEHPAVTCDATQKADDVTMKMRFVLFEDGGRLFQMSAMAPEPFWDGALKKMGPMLASLELREARGTQVALFPDQAAPAAPAEEKPAAKPARKEAAAEKPAEPAPTLTAKFTADELAAMALADDASTLDPEHTFNANLRNRGAGLVPRVAAVDLEGKSATVAAGAVQGLFRVPLGWHVIDDGKRTLVFDAAGKVQVNLSQRLSEGASPRDFARACLDQYLTTQPELPVAVFEIDGIVAAGVRGAKIGDEKLDQAFFVRDLGRPGLLLVARATAAETDSKRALDLAGDIMATFVAPEAAAKN